MLWHCWLGVRKSIWPVKIEWHWGVGVVICLERGADCLHIVQMMPLPSQNPIISCLNCIQTGVTFLSLAYLGFPGKEAVKWRCHSDWLFYGKCCPRLAVVHPGHIWATAAWKLIYRVKSLVCCWWCSCWWWWWTLSATRSCAVMLDTGLRCCLFCRLVHSIACILQQRW